LALNSKKGLRFSCIWLLVALIFWGAEVSWAQAKFHPGSPEAKLSHTLEQLLKSKVLRKAKLALQVVSLSKGDRLFTYRHQQAMTPASNMKLITAATALARLGPEYRFRTEFYLSSRPKQGVVDGDFYIKGYGDPYLVYEEVYKLVRRLSHQGLRKITGNVVADDYYFDIKRLVDGWTPQTQKCYTPETGALSYNFNTLEVSVAPGLSLGDPLLVWSNPVTTYVRLVNQGRTAENGKRLSVKMVNSHGKHKVYITGVLSPRAKTRVIYRPVSDPPRYAASVFRDMLRQQGVKIEGEARTGLVPYDAVLLYEHRSRPLSRLLALMNKYSNNFMAEQILKTLGAEFHEHPGSAAGGAEAVGEFLQEIGVDTAPLYIADGSGLSRKNRLTAESICQVLAYMYSKFELRSEYIASLALPGGTGTFKGRLNGNREAKRIRVKTGNMNGVHTLSGYVGSKNGEVLAFSLLINNYHGYADQLYRFQDKVCLELANFNR